MVPSGDHSYGVLYNRDEEGNIEYITGVEVRDFSDLPTEFSRIRIPAQSSPLDLANYYLRSIFLWSAHSA